MNLNKIRELAEWDKKDMYAELKDAHHVDIHSIYADEFYAGARYQHSKLTPILETLLKICELQAKALDKIMLNGNRGYPTGQEWMAMVDKARATSAEVERLLEEVGG